MALDVVGIGFGRTGTESLKKALELLGYGPCYHMYEVLPQQQRVDEWISLVQGKSADWEKTFSGYRASVDWPGAYFWREIASFYSESKLILTIRDADEWYNSMSNTILPLLRESSADPNSLANQMFISRTFAGNIDDRDHVIDVFNRHNNAAQQAFGPERLLVYELGSGWQPLCEFLGTDVPNTAYPHGNSTDEFAGNIERATEIRESTPYPGLTPIAISTSIQSRM